MRDKSLQETSVPGGFKIKPIIIPSATITKLELYPHGSGGLGDIWKCSMSTDSTQSGTRHVAVKSIRVLQSGDKEILRKAGWKIRHEAYVWIKLSHHHILPFEGVVDGFGQLPALVSLWMENGSLNDYLKKDFGQLTDLRKLELVKQVASGLSYLHSEDIVHGDLTGTNILVDDSRNLRLADFGLSIVVAESGNQTFGSVQTGNTRWMAPEFLEFDFEDGGESQLLLKPTKPGDVYSFGCVMLQILSGKEPYGRIINATQVISAIMRGWGPFRGVEIHMNETHRDLSSQCLTKEPQRRPSIVEVTTIVGEPVVTVVNI